jgi:hypothetical protein
MTQTTRSKLRLSPQPVKSGTYPAPRGGVTALLVGAGLTKAVFPTAPGWGELLRRVAKELKQPAPATKNWFVEGLRLSRNTSPRRRGAQPTRFQRAVRDLVTLSTKRSTERDNAPHWQEMAKALARFIDETNTSVIVDTNYDETVESLLTEAGVPYTRVVGSEVSWVGPLPTAQKALVIWKIHGSVGAASTIVLSPTEYQRLYEANALGPALQKLAAGLDLLWVVGCGLGDDETWAYLCGESGPKAVSCLWLTQDEKMPKTAPPEWLQQVGHPDREVCIFWERVGNDVAAGLAAHLTHIADEVSRVGSANRGDWWDRRISEFEKEYEPHAKASTVRAALSVVDRYRDEFEAMRTYLLSQSAAGMKPTWCGSLDSEACLDASDRARLALDLAAVARAAVSFCKQWGSHQNSSQPAVMVAAAAQAAVAYVVELAEALGIGVEVEMTTLPQTRRLALDKGQRVLVGINPFFIKTAQAQRANPMHVYTTDRRLNIGFPLVSGPPTETGRLLSEDEWEASIVHLYRSRSPRLVFEGVDPIEIRDVPPLYPWGFRLLDIRAYRAGGVGTVSRRWHLVSDVEGDWQVCKGGGLRDSGRVAFRIGNRGRVRIGEFDAFLEPANHHE